MMNIVLAYALCFISAVRFERVVKIVVDGKLAYLGTETINGKWKAFYFRFID